MPTPKKRYRYTFLYTDQTYLTYELTKEDYASLEAALCHGEEWKYVAVSIGIVGLENIRSVIEQKEPEIDLDADQEILNGSDTLPVLDQESYNWIKQYMEMGGNS